MAPYCHNGTCAAPPCDPDAGACGAGSVCCGATCCAPGQLCCTIHEACCDVTKCQDPTPAGTCDIGDPCTTCTSPDTPVATPDGERAIASLRAGDLVYSVEENAIVAVPIVRVSRTLVRSDHRIVEVALENGAVLGISPRHPTADGRFFAELAVGDRLGSVEVVSVKLVPYAGEFTYDILPASTTAFYFAAGAMIGSTLMAR
jgi:hypothetical protein